MRSSQKNRWVFGNAMMEYALPLAILVGASGILLTVGNFPAYLKTYLANDNLAKIDNHQMLIPALGSRLSSTGSHAGPANSSASPVSGEQRICLQSGFCIDIPIIAGGGSVSETVGGLGGNLTSALANVFDQIVQQLKAQNADSALINLVTQLALDAHGIGNKLNTTQSQCGANSTSCDVDLTVSGFAAGSITTTKAPNGDTIQDWKSVLSTTTFQQDQQALNDYFSAHPGQYKDVASIINLESGQILNIAAGLNVAHQADITQIDNAADTGKPMPAGSELTSVTQSTSGHVTTTMHNINIDGTITNSSNDAVLVHQDANTICNTGGNTSICTQ